jgi:carboxypeptidase C (cathepsin A)
MTGLVRLCIKACVAGSLLLSFGAAFAQQQAPAARERAPQQGPHEQRGGGPHETVARNAPEGLPVLPPDKATQHTLTLADGATLRFTATAGTIRLLNGQSGAPIADVAYIAYTKDGAQAGARPVTFVFNGGPGYASGWLNLGGLGPWRLRMDGSADRPSAPPITSDNADTWLDFTDLVFIDPPGTGYGRVLGGGDNRKALWSVNGDIDALATTVRRWVEQNNRMESPKFIAGESYGGFRAPKVAHELNVDQGVGIAGLVMISPVLDFGGFNARFSPLSFVAALPSMAAVARSAKGPISKADLADVETYAQGDFLADLLKGVNDKAAVARLSSKVAALTGLNPALVRRLDGRVPANVFLRAFWRSKDEIASQYDGTVAGFDPVPFASRSRADDQLRLGLHAPIVEAMVNLYHQKLDWNVVNGRYLFLNEQASRQWDWGSHDAEAISDLRKDLALDPQFRVLIAQGLTDLVAPYFGTQMLLNQIPDYGPPGRLRLRVYPGGHMVYIRDASRKMLHDDARTLVSAPPAAQTQPKPTP